ncbi:MAG: hypothetical protein ACYC96_11660 [Fimbriimonadaceae bacterium]
MIVNNLLAKSCAVAALASVGSAPAQAQSITSGPPAQWFTYTGHSDTWNTVLLVSGLVGVVGLVNGDGTLVILGGAGVLLSLYETANTRFDFQGLRQGPRFLKYGQVSFGVNLEPGLALAPGLGRPQPCPCVEWNIKL